MTTPVKPDGVIQLYLGSPDALIVDVQRNRRLDMSVPEEFDLEFRRQGGIIVPFSTKNDGGQLS